MEKRKPIDVTIGTNMSKLRKQFNLTLKAQLDNSNDSLSDNSGIFSKKQFVDTL